MNDLLNNLINRVNSYTYPINPRKREKAAKKDPKYLHVSVHYIETHDDEGNVTGVRRIGITYYKH